MKLRVEIRCITYNHALCPYGSEVLFRAGAYTGFLYLGSASGAGATLTGSVDGIAELVGNGGCRTDDDAIKQCNNARFQVMQQKCMTITKRIWI